MDKTYIFISLFVGIMALSSCKVTGEYEYPHHYTYKLCNQSEDTVVAHINYLIPYNKSMDTIVKVSPNKKQTIYMYYPNYNETPISLPSAYLETLTIRSIIGDTLYQQNPIEDVIWEQTDSTYVENPQYSGLSIVWQFVYPITE